jgi:hypothetical protein
VTAMVFAKTIGHAEAQVIQALATRAGHPAAAVTA